MNASEINEGAGGTCKLPSFISAICCVDPLHARWQSRTRHHSHVVDYLLSVHKKSTCAMMREKRQECMYYVKSNLGSDLGSGWSDHR
jgi:hypothetical protein